MDSYRIGIENLVNREEIDKGTAAQFTAINAINNRKGVYKVNGCMMFSDNEDLRENLASNILNLVGKKAAEIELTYDEENDEKGCFSYYIINEDEDLISGESNQIVDSNYVSDYINWYVDEIKGLEGITDKNIEDRRKHVIETIYMDCILDNGDRKSDNMEMVYNHKTGQYYNAPLYDYGTAFTNTSNGNGPFRKIPKEEVLKQLVDNYYDDIKDLAGQVESNITKGYLKKELNKKCYIDGFSKETRKKIMTGVMDNVKYSKKLCKSKEQNKDMQKDSFFKRFLSRIRGEKTEVLPEAYDNGQKILNNDGFEQQLGQSVYPPNENDVQYNENSELAQPQKEDLNRY